MLGLYTEAQVQEMVERAATQAAQSTVATVFANLNIMAKAADVDLDATLYQPAEQTMNAEYQARDADNREAETLEQQAKAKRDSAKTHGENGDGLNSALAIAGYNGHAF